MTYTRLNPRIKTAGDSQAFTIGANARISVDISLPTPSGYTFCGVTKLTTTNTWVDVTGWAYENNKLTVTLRNHNNAQYTATAVASVAFMPS